MPFNRLYRALILPGLVLFAVTGYIALTSPLQPAIDGNVGYPVWVRVAGAFVVGPTSIILGWFVARRMKDSLIGPYIVHWGCATNAELGVGYLPAFWGALCLYYLNMVILPGLTLMLASFPTGRGVTTGWDRIMKALTLIWTGFALFDNLSAPRAYGLTSPSPLAIDFLVPLSDLFTSLGYSFIVVLLLAVALMLYRYRITNETERKQMRWLLLLGLSLLVFFVYSSTLDFAALSATEEFVFSVMALLAFALPSLTISLAILRHRLWDIDLIIRRTLIYSALTGLLALVYFSSVLALQSLLRGVTREDSPVVIVLSTLLIAALATPLRRGVQRGIDRRFYRRKYDAARTLAAFGARARDETDLDRLGQRLLQVVDESMQPAHVGLWLKRTEGSTQTLETVTRLSAPSRTP
jgi:hypothetical protein